jgi:hypothetical protein
VISRAGLRRLETAAERGLDRERRALARLDEAMRALRDEGAVLRRMRPDDATQLAMRGEAATLVRSWEALRERRLVVLAQRIAERAAERDEARSRVARACGRMIAIRKLAARDDG